MEARAQSEARQDFHFKLTPIPYEDIRHTQGELHQRQQISSPFRQPNDHSKLQQNQQIKPSFAAINLESAIKLIDLTFHLQHFTSKIMKTTIITLVQLMMLQIMMRTSMMKKILKS